jgi:hypothetical protein
MEFTSMFQAYTRSFYVACVMWISYTSYHELSNISCSKETTNDMNQLLNI